MPIGPKQTHPVDLAALYWVQTKRLKEQVKRNRGRLPSDFLFQLTTDVKTERQPGKEALIGLILCAESRAELPPKAEPEQKLHAALLEAREHLARRGLLLGTWMRSDELKVSKGVGFPVVALAGVGCISAKRVSFPESSNYTRCPQHISFRFQTKPVSFFYKRDHL